MQLGFSVRQHAELPFGATAKPNNLDFLVVAIEKILVVRVCADAGARVRRLGQRRRTLDDLFEAHALEGADADAGASDASEEQT